MADSDTGANPLLLSWVKEWWETAKQRKSKGEITYKHAYDSLRACPQKFSHPSELKVLRGFGDKLCQRLTEQLQKHCNEHGLPMPSRKRKRAIISREGALDDPVSQAPPAQRSRTTGTTRKYVPQPRSGAFAILYVLGGQDPSAQIGMSKDDLIAEAQAHCDASLTVESDTSRYYTAWGSMKTLLEKELVYERGRPVKRYALTEEGKKLALSLRQVENSSSSNASNGPFGGGDRLTSSTAAGSAAGSSNSQPRPASARMPAAPPRETTSHRPTPQPQSGGGYGFYTGAGYADYERENWLNVSSQPATTISNASTINFGATRHAPAHTSARAVAAQPVIVLDDDDDDVVVVEDQDPKPKNEEYKDVVADGDTVLNNSTLPNITPIRLAPGSFTVELILDNREVRAKHDRDYMQREFIKRGIRPITRPLPLGDFLWVAKCKQPGWLERMGASESRLNAEGHRDTAGDEVVLDWIVERKRLDDLTRSIQDKRFHEQKYRLRRSGVKNVVYIMEHKVMDEERRKKWEATIETVFAQIEVVDCWFLKKTKTTDETIKYLASVTQMLKEMYEGKALYVIRSKDLTAKNYLPLLNHLRETKPDMSHHIVYPAFASLCSKSDMMTLRDVFLKMLMCIKGLTGEKAIEIQKIWKTPHEFIKAYENCGPGEEGRQKKINMVSDRTDHLFGNQKMSKCLSAKIAEVWGDA